MEIKNIWTKEQVSNYLKGIQVNVNLDPDYIYDVYEMANEFISIVDQENAQIEVKEINQFELLLYCVGEYYYSISHLNAEELARFKANEEYPSSMASVAADKYLSLSRYLLFPSGEALSPHKEEASGQLWPARSLPRYNSQYQQTVYCSFPYV